MFIKEAIVNVGRRILSQKQIAHVQAGILTQFLIFTTLKNYIYQWMTQEQLFIIPDNIRDRSNLLDMDETLVYTRRDAAPGHSNYVTTDLGGETMYVEPRPYAKQFLKSAAQIFTIYIYTAGKKPYADAVLNAIDDQRLIQKRFYRDSCKRVNGKLVKDLRYLKKTLRLKEEMILVDDNNDSINNNYPFALKIEAFEGDQSDLQLVKIFEKVLKFYH